MIRRFQCLPGNISRRKFNMQLFGAAAGLTAGSKILGAADPDFTVAVITDTQYLSLQCSAAFSALTQWIVDNLAASQGGVFDTNIKAVIGVGDCAHNAGSGEYTTAQTAYAKLTTAGVPWVNPPGNHDYTGTGSSRSALGPGYGASGYFGASSRQTLNAYGSLPGGGGSSAWGDAYDTANYYVKLTIGARRIMVFSVEHEPRAAVLTWAKAASDANPTYECIVSTHGFLTDTSGFSTYTSEPGNQVYTNANSGAGLVTTQATSDASFNSGYSQWTNYLSTWANLRMIVCGHWIYQAHHTGLANPWFYQSRALTSSSPAAQTVRGIFANWQECDEGNYSSLAGGGGNVAPGTYCPSWPAASGTARIAHVMLLHFRPSIGKLEGYALSTASGKWEPTFANSSVAPTSTPQLLFSVDYPDPIPTATRFMISQ